MQVVLQDTALLRKARGAFFTPSEITEFIAEWGIRGVGDRVLEPSCGEAAFLSAAGSTLLRAGQTDDLARQLHGYEIHAASATTAKAILAENGIGATIGVGDFFETLPKQDSLFDVVIGNPPYVRYQNFAGASRTAALEAALRQGVRLTQLASSWAAFTVHATAFLKPGGRLGLVLPAELLSVKYAAQIREFLLRRFAKVRLVLFDHLVFPGVQEDVILLLAEGQGSASHFEVYQAKDAKDLKSLAPANWVGFTPKGSEKWTNALLPAEAVSLYDEVFESHGYEVMADWGETYLGAVTGNNEFFTLTKADVAERKLRAPELMRISPPGSRHLRGLTFSEHAWTKLADEGGRCYLFAPEAEPSEEARKYIAHGQRLGVQDAYKCKVREPWWRVPVTPRPDFLFAYMSHDRPRLVRNGAGVQLLNSLYGIRLHAKRRDVGNETLAVASLNSMTLLGAEVVGRAYGGGMLKHEPTEVGALPIPSFEVLSSVSARLKLLSPQISALLRSNDITPAVEIVDRVILKDHLKFSDQKIKSLRKARQVLLDRRMTRRKA
ncbi:adenine-specific DNA-methyltransferase [Variovorax paradoxus]|uniref:HsdM family class I SAM-dependent methyltransferase n=1 Tax=Variovorax paradoxus TaxID=34073 RepID=UPI00278D95C8|nr:N-6 DNA methylase [Variovorax paradoxus]MDQ0572616.1 adenine-specific DNA-methyltransferase [Variovorax paradoxus]